MVPAVPTETRESLAQELVAQGWTGAAATQITNKVTADLAAGKTMAKVAQRLVDQGWDPRGASFFVDKAARAAVGFAQTPEGRKAVTRKYKRYMLWGAVAFAAALIFSVVTIQQAVTSSEGGYFIVWFGPMIGGGYFFFRGLNGWLKYRY